MPSTELPRAGAFVCPGVTVVGPDGEEYWTTKEAAAAMDVAPATVASWRRRGYLQAVPGSPARRPLYRRQDVQAAEKQAYEAAMRTSGSPKRTSRRFDPAPQSF